MTKPMFSLLHPTKRLPDGWRASSEAWASACDRPERCEYILVVDADDYLFRPSVTCWAARVWVQIAMNRKRPCTVDAWNLAAKLSIGTVLVCLADDCFPCNHWDTLMLEALGDLSRESVLWVDTQDQMQLITHPILTRAYYERPGRGGCGGELLYPDYISVGSDDDFTEYASKDGVVIDARNRIHLEHRHPSTGKTKVDAVYAWSNRQEAWDRKVEVLARRRAGGFKS